MKNWDKILADFARKCKGGAPDMTNSTHLALLRESLLKFGWKENASNEFIGNLREGKEIVTEEGWYWDTASEKFKKAYIKKHGQAPTRRGSGGDEEGGENDKKGEDEEWKKGDSLEERPRTKMSKEERAKMKDLASREDELSPEEKKELRNLRDKRDNEKVDTALHMTKSEFNTLTAEYKVIEEKIKNDTATEEDLKRKEELEEKGIGAGTAESQAGEAITHFTLRMLKDGYTEEQIEAYLNNLVSNEDHVLGGSKALRGWVPRGMAAAQRVIKEVGGIDNIKTISWDTDEGRQAMNVSPDYKTSSDMFVETNDGTRIGVSLKKDGQVRILSGGWDKQQRKLTEGMLANDKSGELKKKKFRKKDGTLTTDKNDPDIEVDASGVPVVTTSIEEFERQAGSHTHKKEVDSAAKGAAKDISDGIEKDGWDGPDGKELNKIVEDEEYGAEIIGEKRLKHLKPRVGKKVGYILNSDGELVKVEGEEARKAGIKQFLQRMKNGPKSKDNPDGYTAEDLIIMAKILQKSDLRDRHEKHHDDMRDADENLTKRTMDALKNDPALMEASKNFILDKLHIDKSLGFDLGDDIDEFVQIFGIGDDGVAMNAETLVGLFGPKFESVHGQVMVEVEQIKKDYKSGKITREEAQKRMDEQKARVYEVIRDDLEVDYESGTIKFKQEFPNPGFDESKPESEENPKMKVSEYSLFDWFARAKGLGRAVAMELQNNEFMIFALSNGTPDINEWEDKEQARWFNKENNKINKEKKERIEAGEKPPFDDLEKRREENDKKWGKVDPDAVKKASSKRK